MEHSDGWPFDLKEGVLYVIGEIVLITVTAIGIDRRSPGLWGPFAILAAVVYQRASSQYRVWAVQPNGGGFRRHSVIATFKAGSAMAQDSMSQT